MYYRKNVLETAKALTDDGDTTIEMKGSGILNALTLFFRAQCASDIQAKGGQNFNYWIDKVNILGNGKEDIISLSGEELAACAIYDERHWIDEMAQAYGNKSQWFEIPVNFGRFFKDHSMGLDIGKFTSLDLVITLGNASTTYFAANPTCRVSQFFMEDLAQTPRHYLKRTTFKKDKPSAANQWVRYTVPENLKVRRLMCLLDHDLTIATNTPTNYATTDSNKISVSFLNGKEWLYKEDQIKSIFRENSLRYGRLVRQIRQAFNTTIYIDTQMGYVEGFALAPIEEGTGADTTLPSLPDENGRYVLPKFAGTADHFGLVIHGTAPFSSFVIPFDYHGIEGYLDTSVKKPVKVEWQPTTADHAFRLVIEELATN